MTQAIVGGADTERRQDIDWEAIERSPEFRELVRRKKAFVIPATIFFLAWYFGFVSCAATRRTSWAASSSPTVSPSATRWR